MREWRRSGEDDAPRRLSMDSIAGVDIGATRLRVALGDGSGKIVAKASERSSQRASPTALEEQVIRSLSRLLGEHGSPKLGCIGVASTGPLDRRGGIVDPANLPQTGFIPLARPLIDTFGSDVLLINDCSAAAVAEKEVGLGKGFDNLVYVTLSTGIGAGVFVDGHLLVGKDGNAHEVGHMVIDLEGRLVCGCGRAGHWEAYCSGRNIPRLAPLVLDDATEARRVGALTSLQIYELSRGGDKACASVVREVGLLNAMGFATIIDLYDPALVVVGGSVALNNGDQVLSPIRERIGDLTRNRVPILKLTEMGEDVVISGALLAALHVADYRELKPWTYPAV
jgi:glucokinase